MDNIFSLCKQLKSLENIDKNKFLLNIKFNGQRVILNKDLISRRRVILNDKYSHIYNELKNLDVVLDGEICYFNDKGITDFVGLCLKENWGKAVFVVFDILKHGGIDLRGKPYSFRVGYLKCFFKEYTFKHIKQADAFGYDINLIKKWEREGREGIIVKRKDGKYVPYRTSDWLKFKFWKSGTFKIIGFEEVKGLMEGWGAFTIDNGTRVGFRSWKFRDYYIENLPEKAVVKYREVRKSGKLYSPILVKFMNESIR